MPAVQLRRRHRCNVGRQVSLCCPVYVTSSRTPAYTNEPLQRPRQRPIYIALSWPRDGHERCKSLQRIVDTHRFNTLEYLLCVFTVAVIYLAHHARISIGQYIVIRGIQFTVGENEHRSFVRGMVASKIDGFPPSLSRPRFRDYRFRGFSPSSSSLLFAVNKRCHVDAELIELRKRLATYN